MLRAILRAGFVVFAAAVGGCAQSGPTTIQVASVDYAEGRLSGARVISTESGTNHDPIWSPDGKSVAYVAEQPHEDQRSLVIRAADTGRLIRVHRLSMGSFFPLVWTQTSLYGTGWTKQDGGGIYRVHAETGVAAVVHKGTGHIRISKDGKNVYFGRSVDNRAGMVLVERKIAEGSEREVMRWPWFQGMALSPDNNYLVTAGVDHASNSRTILLVTLATGEVRELQRVASDLNPAELTDWAKGAKFWHAEWRYEGQSFLVRKRFSDESQDDEVWEVPVDGTPRKFALQFPRTVLTYRLQPGGNQVTWTTHTGSFEKKP